MIDFNSIDKNVPVLESRGLCRHLGSLKAVESVDMKITTENIFGITGPNGAGKVIFFNMHAGIYAPTKGKIYLMGEDATGSSPEKVARKRMARTLQNLQLFKLMSVFDNARIECHIRTKSNTLDAIAHTRTYKQNEEYAVSKSEGILKAIGPLEYRDTMTGSLAYGIQRKVEIARALVLEPYILLPDEPATGMSSLETQELMESIEMLDEGGHTVAVIEHDMKFITNSCSRILVLNFGQKICEGTSNEVEASHQVQEAYFGKGIVAGEAVRVRA